MEFVIHPSHRGDPHAFSDKRDTPSDLWTQLQQTRLSGSVVDVQSRREDERFDLPLLVYYSTLATHAVLIKWSA
jgi:hypothetical protein